MQASKRALLKRRGAACAAAAVLIGSTLTAGAAQAAPSPDTAPAAIGTEALLDVAAPSVESLFGAYVDEYGTTSLESVTVDGAGNFTIRTGEPASAGPATASPMSRSVAPTKLSDDEFAAKFKTEHGTESGSVTIDRENVTGPATAFATDVVNGQGIMFGSGGSLAECSIGWNGFNAQGEKAVITAGHCAADGTSTVTALTDSTKEPAVGGPGFDPTEKLGTFGFSQFGGPKNSPATAPPGWNQDPNTVNNVGTDVAVIDGINPDLNQLAKVTDWTTPASPKNSGPLVTNISEAIPGANICKSGRTTGWTCGTVAEKAIFLVGGRNFANDPNDVRAVRGFSSKDLVAKEGDSGGAIISGTTAVGMISAGGKDGTVYGVSLTDALKHTDGYTVKLALSAPKVTTTAPVFRSTDVTGTVANAPAGTKVSVTIDGQTTNAVVGTDGTWSVKAPNKFGTFAVTAQAKNGYNTSKTTTASIEVIKQTLTTPTIAAPAPDGAVATPVTVITGAGKAGATIELTGDVTGTTKVGEDRTWSFTVSPALEVGSYSITAKQTLDGWNDSQTATNKFTVMPAAPATTSPNNGQEFAFDQGPSAISGTNVKGATVALDVNGTKLAATVTGTTWSVSLGDKLATGEYSVSVVQTVNGIESQPGTSAFKVLGAPAPPATQEPASAPTTEPVPSAAPAPTTAPVPSAAPSQAPNDSALANTGASSSTLMLGVAGGVLLLGGVVFLLLRRRNSAN